MPQSSQLVKCQCSNSVEYVKRRQKSWRCPPCPETTDDDFHDVTRRCQISRQQNECWLRSIPRFMDSPEAVAEQVLRIQAFYILHLFWKMTLWGVVTEHMSYNCPGFFTALDDPALKVAERSRIVVLGIGICQHLPDISAKCQLVSYMRKSVRHHTQAMQNHRVPNR